MTDIYTREEFAHAINMLDACEDALDLAAKAEAHQEQGRPLQRATHQLRAEHIKRFVAKYSDLLA